MLTAVSYLLLNSLTLNEDYTPDAPYHDIAILKLKKKLGLNGKTKRAVTLARARDKIVAGRNVSLSGWGRDSQKGTDNLYRVHLNIVDYEKCAEKWGFTTEEMEEHEVCALGNDDSEQQCQVSFNCFAIRQKF